MYRSRAILSRGLYSFYPIFHCGSYCRAVSITDNLCIKQWILHFLGLKSAVYNQKRVIIMACIPYRNRSNWNLQKQETQKYSVTKIVLTFQCLNKWKGIDLKIFANSQSETYNSFLWFTRTIFLTEVQNNFRNKLPFHSKWNKAIDFLFIPVKLYLNLFPQTYWQTAKKYDIYCKFCTSTY